MLDKQPINRFLPVSFGRGTTVRHFSKPCVRCGQVLQAAQMVGVVRVIEDHIALAADAHCPHCSARFGVACVIDQDKRVRPVPFPATVFSWYLRILPGQPGEQLPESSESPEGVMPPLGMAPPPAEEQDVTDVRVTLSPDYPRSADVVGSYQGRPIASHIVVNGQKIPFDRIALQDSPAAGEYLIDGLFIYKPR